MKITLVLLAVILGSGVLIYNSLVSARVRVDAAWSQIDVQLQRRLDLIQNLVETVKGYAAHEKSTFEAVTQARTAALQSTNPKDVATSQNQVTNALGRLMLLAESYPELKANTNFLALQDELSGTESRISYSRNYYNESVQIFNAKISTFPSNIVAGLMHLLPRTFFEADAGSRTAPRVQF